MKKVNRCQDCGKCCLKSNMVLSGREYHKILKKFKDLSQFNIFLIGNDNFLRMLTIKHQCIFFDLSEKKCSIYKVRPLGCRIYPLIYDFELGECRFGETCPKPKDFYSNKKSIRKACKKLKKYLKDDLLIENVVIDEKEVA